MHLAVPPAPTPRRCPSRRAASTPAAAMPCRRVIRCRGQLVMCCRGQLVMLLAPVKVHTHTDADKGTQPAPTRKWREGVGGTCIVMPWSLPNGIVSLSGKAAKGSGRSRQRQRRAAAVEGKASGTMRQPKDRQRKAVVEAVVVIESTVFTVQGKAAKKSGRGSARQRQRCHAAVVVQGKGSGAMR